MILNELSAVPSEDLPIVEFSEHLHLGSGFADDGSQNSVLEAYLRAAIAAVEARTGKALYLRRFSWMVYGWILEDAQGIPVSPVKSIESLRVISSSGMENVIEAIEYGLFKDKHFPTMRSQVGRLPHIPDGGRAEIIVEAGFGPAWSDIPADLRQSILMLAANFYENRHGNSGGDNLPAGVLALLEPYRKMRLSGGAI